MADVKSTFVISLRDDVSGSLKNISSGLGRFKGEFAAVGIGVAAAGAAIGTAVKQAINFADNLGKTAQKVGVSVESLSALKFAADLADVSFEQLSKGVRQLSRSMGNVAAGSTEAIRVFSALGVSAQNADGSLRKTEDVLRDISDAFQGLPDGATKTALAMRLFGRAGADLIPLLNGGSDGLDKMRKEAERFGVVISTETSRQAEEFNDNLTRLKAAAAGLAVSMTAGILPSLASLTTEFIAASREAEGLLGRLGAIGTALSREFTGKDQQRLGALLLQEIEIESRLAELESSAANQFTLRSRKRSLDRLRSELQAVQAEIKGLETVLQPEQRGEGRGPAVVSSAAEESARKERERLAALSLAKDEDAAKRQKEQERQAKAQTDYLNGLRRQLELEGQSTELARVNADIKFGSAAAFADEVKEQSRQLADQLDILKESTEVHEYLLEVERERRAESAMAVKAREAEVRATIESLRTPLEAYADTVQKLVALGLDDINLQRGIEKAKDELEAAQGKLNEVDNAAKDLGITFSSAFEDAILGANSLRDVLDGLLKDIARIFIRKSITEPLIGAVTGALGGEGGLFSGLFKNSRGGLYRVGGSSGEHPVAFTAKAGEVVAVGTGMQSGNGGINVVVNNYSGERVKTREGRDPSGRRQLEIMVGELTAGNIGSGRLAPLGFAPALAAR